MRTIKKIILGLSGGVDSSTAASLLLRMGHEVCGVTLLMREEDESCSDARQVCDALGIEHLVVDARERFRNEVIDKFMSLYSKGLTPNPCVLCNPAVKFPLLAEEADRRGFSHIATGHYASVVRNEANGSFRIRRGAEGRDQSYFLYPLSQALLSRTLLPLGGYDKAQVREIARREKVPVAEKSDSQDICFIPEGNHAAFLRRIAPDRNRPGRFVDENGGFLGVHDGIWGYTVGQRKGLGLSLPRPMYVGRIEADSGDITLVEDAGLYSRGLIAGPLSWADRDEAEAPRRFHAKIRSNHKPCPAEVFPLESGGARVIFDTPQRAVTPGQSVVFYDGEFVAGGGVIVSACDA